MRWVSMSIVFLVWALSLFGTDSMDPLNFPSLMYPSPLDPLQPFNDPMLFGDPFLTQPFLGADPSWLAAPMLEDLGGRRLRKKKAADFWRRSLDAMEERESRVSEEEMQAGLDMMRRPRRLRELTDLLMANFYFLDSECDESVGEYAWMGSEVMTCVERGSGEESEEAAALVRALRQAVLSSKGIGADAAEGLIALGLVEASSGMLVPSVKGYISVLSLEAVVLNCIDDVSSEMEGFPGHRAVEFNWD